MFFRYSTSIRLALLTCLASTCLTGYSQESTITVSATGATRIKPDRIQVHVSISNTEDGIIEAREVSDGDAKKVLAAAQKHGVAESDFKVNDLRISIGFSSELRRNLYTVTRDVSIDLGDMTKLNGLLADLLETKNTKVRSIDFRASGEKKAEFKARQLAMESAKEKAAQLAELADLKLGRAISIDVVSERNTPFVTSVEPTVGSNGGGLFLHARTNAAKQSIRLSGNPKNSIGSRQRSLQETATNQAQGRVFLTRSTPKNQAFGLGEIAVSISLEVTFQMIEKGD